MSRRFGTLLPSRVTGRIWLESFAIIVSLLSLSCSSAFAQIGPKPEILNLFQLVARACPIALPGASKAGARTLLAHLDAAHALADVAAKATALDVLAVVDLVDARGDLSLDDFFHRAW